VCVDVCVDIEVLMTLQYHRDLFQRGVAGTLSDAVDRDLHLPCSGQNAVQGIRRRHAQIVMTVGGDDRLVDVVDMLFEILDLRSILRGQAVARGIGYVHHRGTGLDDGLHHSCEILIVGPPGVLGIKFHVLHIFLGIGHSLHRPLDDLLGGGVELIFNMVFAGSYAGVNAFVLGILQRLGSHIDVFFHGARQRTDRRPRHGLGYFDHRVEVARRGYGESGLYNVHAKQLQLFGHLNFLYRVQLTTRHLFAVSEGRVKNVKSLAHNFDFILTKTKKPSHCWKWKGSVLCSCLRHARTPFHFRLHSAVE